MAVSVWKKGTYYWQASYSGNGNTNSDLITCTDEHLLRDQLSFPTRRSSDLSSIDVKQSAHDSATLSGATADAGGTVTYTVYTDNTCSTKAVAGTDINEMGRAHA